MKKLSALFIIFFVSITANQAIYAKTTSITPADITGTWKGHMYSDISSWTSKVTFILKARGNKVSGTMQVFSSSTNNSPKPVSGTISGNLINIKNTTGGTYPLKLHKRSSKKITLKSSRAYSNGSGHSGTMKVSKKLK